MRKFFSTMVIFIIAALPLAAQEMSMEDAMKLAQPGPQHEMLKSLEGKFDVTFKYWMMPNADPMTGTGITENKMILGGRFLESKGATEMMGETKEAVYIFGFDNRIKKHTLFLIDEFGTYSVSVEGEYNENDKTISYYGVDSLTTAGMQLRFKFILNMSNADAYTFEVHYQGTDGNYAKAVEVTHIRKIE